MMQLLNPGIERLANTDSDIDNNGIVTRIDYRNTSFLLTADIGKDAELELILGRAELECTVLKSAHHGSDISSSAEFLSVTRPQYAVISAGEDNRFGHPKGELFNRLEQAIGSGRIYRTDLNGTIEFLSDGENLYLKTSNQANIP